MNKVLLIGRTTNDIVLQENKNGNTYCYFTLAVNNGKDNTVFLNCLAWNQVATVLNNFVKKGHQLGVEGVLNAYSTKNEDGGYVQHYNVVATKLTLLTQNKLETSSTEQVDQLQEAKEQVEEEESFNINFEDIQF